jgi:hypothetical protein
MKYEVSLNTSGIGPLKAFLLKSKWLILDATKVFGILPVKLLYFRFSESRTDICPNENGIGPDNLFNDRSKSASP